jgi:predicted  nucleic acid-binding Zn-ribbon protein
MVRLAKVTESYEKRLDKAGVSQNQANKELSDLKNAMKQLKVKVGAVETDVKKLGPSQKGSKVEKLLKQHADNFEQEIAELNSSFEVIQSENAILKAQVAVKNFAQSIAVNSQAVTAAATEEEEPVTMSGLKSELRKVSFAS